MEKFFLEVERINSRTKETEESRTITLSSKDFEALLNVTDLITYPLQEVFSEVKVEENFEEKTAVLEGGSLRVNLYRKECIYGN